MEDETLVLNHCVTRKWRTVPVASCQKAYCALHLLPLALG